MSNNSNLSVAVVCSSNMNRSMEAHHFLAKKGFNVRSFGTGERVKLPGTAIDKPNVYEFGTPYDTIYQDLLTKDKQYYTQNGLLHMLDRNRRIKKCPERFQECKEQFDIIVTVEERVYDQVLEHMESCDPIDNRPVHVFNVDIEDNHEEALMGAFLITDMINMMAKSTDLDNDIDELLQEFESRRNKTVLHSVLFY
ncbi:PREDICTED: RNA polymerase II subunit A C-terminal domain phosphatase SSU72 [Bactrocera latifrons]|uniref:RNA polymerase II subunit A C-terminal domain phosphatase SSU72 n=2 Tax=Bactrocera TaxID=47832 RepID=A0A6I9W4I8_BACDO|nr:RNA polymerase II subunit A C-terminal domain phosphatase SSU72 [Bactrocera dorsalis]XP_014093413.1 RNA polymerase II subunit A C-terminal domain phosphatase SSU72 [Bactrocera oleae]XP_018784314.1 PREDICTED: RNA polymerase II subunit A C-terminal domain phosphatase SSU72 [Bactrocera latifrons]XP_039962533.1 RNA polymerase II subunit A C-terminal domain phosphatase SSU72 isoform X2 [Bactrocera tryoni]XP_050332699.1 RNA polymerase II subunit A C-terminal domain phosphatase SSU72 isoform X2 [Ba